MPQRRDKTSGPGSKPKGNERQEERKAEEEGEDSCRCKEVAKKTPFEMLRLMFSDLAFWKKTKK